MFGNMSDKAELSPAAFDLSELEDAIMGTAVLLEAPAASMLVQGAGVGTLNLPPFRRASGRPPGSNIWRSVRAAHASSCSLPSLAEPVDPQSRKRAQSQNLVKARASKVAKVALAAKANESAASLLKAPILNASQLGALAKHLHSSTLASTAAFSDHVGVHRKWLEHLPEACANAFCRAEVIAFQTLLHQISEAQAEGIVVCARPQLR